MNITPTLRPLAACLLAIALAACGGGGSADPAAAGGTGGTPDSTGSGGTTSAGGSGGTHAGMGSSTAAPTGTALQLPAGVQLQKPIKGDDPFCVPPDQKDKPKAGSGGLVRLCLGFGNSTALPITIVLPPGLIYVSDDEVHQNGVLLHSAQIEVPANTPVFYVPLYLYCLNQGRSPTEGGQNTYSRGPVTDDPAVRELLTLLQDKPLPLVFDINVQNALWHITDGNGLTDDDRRAIAAL